MKNELEGKRCRRCMKVVRSISWVLSGTFSDSHWMGRGLDLRRKHAEATHIFITRKPQDRETGLLTNELLSQQIPSGNLEGGPPLIAIAYFEPWSLKELCPQWRTAGWGDGI